MATTKELYIDKPKKTKSTPKPIPDLAVNPFAFEVFDVVTKQKSKARRVEALRKFDHPSLKALFIWNFDESVITLLPEGEVPYASVGEQGSFTGTVSEKVTDAVNKMEEIGSQSLGAQDQGFSSIRKEYDKFYNFLKGGNDSLSGLRRETIFINLLQGLHPLEVEIVCLVKDKKLQSKYKTITKELVSEAYPDITWGGRS